MSCLGNLITAGAAGGGRWPFVILGMAILGSGGGLLNGETQNAIMGSVPRDRAGMASGISTTARFSGILLGFALLNAAIAIIARSLLTADACAAFVSRCEAAGTFARLVIAGDVPKAAALMSPDRQAVAIDIAHRGYAAGFSGALFIAAIVAGSAAVLVAALMRPVGVEPSSAIAFAAEQEGLMKKRRLS